MLLNKAYYTVKFLVPRRLQIQLRRYYVNRKRSSYADIWPIDPNAGKPLGIWGHDAASCPHIPNWPNGKKFALVLTHDVESAQSLDKCYQLAKMEERLGFRSSFNFVGGDYAVPAALRQYLTDRGFEIGVHGLHHDNNPFRSKSVFRKQSVAINRTLKEWGAVGFRSPSMYHDLEMLHHLDIEYDASTFDTDPFEPQPDGMGTIFPFWVPDRDIQEDALIKSPPNGHTGESRYPELLKDTGFRVKPGMTTEANYDLLRDRQKGYVELPYTLPQDFLLFVLMQEKNIDIWKKKLDWIADQGGMALFIAHPGYMRFNNSHGLLPQRSMKIPPYPPLVKGGYMNPPPFGKGGYMNPPPLVKGGYMDPPPFVKGGYMKTPPLVKGGWGDFHINALGYDEYPVRYYEEFLEYIKSRYEGQYWHALPRDVARFWVSKNGLQTISPINPNPLSLIVPNPLPLISRPSTLTPRPRPTHACMLVYSFYESDNRVMRYAEALVKRGDSVDVIALGKEGTPRYEEIRGVKVYRIQKRMIDEKGKISYLLKLIAFLFNSSIFLTNRHLRNPYDLIHVHSVPDFEVFATIFPKLQGAKIILDIHDIVPEFYASKFHENEKSILFKALVMLERLSSKYADHVIISNHLWEKTLLSRSVERDKCTVIMNYPDESIFYKRPRERNDGKFIMIYPGTLGWHQGLDIAIQAFALIKDQAPESEFHIYGRGPEKKNLERLIAELGLGNRVFIKETVPIEQIARVMANADLGIIPKRNDPFGGEAFSTKILEFMTLGIPVIVSETKIDKFYFNDSVLKFFKPDDANDLAQCMLSLRNDKILRDRLRENAQKYVEKYNWEKRKQEYLELVDSLTKNTLSCHSRDASGRESSL